MNRLLLAISVLGLLADPSWAITLSDRMHSTIAKGNRRYDAEDHEQALGLYMEAQGQDSTHVVPHFNAGDALYRLGRFEDGAGEFLRSAGSLSDSISAMSYYNLGNSLFQTGDIKSAAEAYKRSLLIDPDDEDAKYNLEYALRMLEQQQQQQQQQDQSEGKQDQQQEQQPDSGTQDEQQQEKQEKQEDQAQQEQREQEQADEQRQEPAGAPKEMTPEDLERILAAIEASDRKTQEEMLKKASRRKRITGKDW